MVGNEKKKEFQENNSEAKDKPSSLWAPSGPRSLWPFTRTGTYFLAGTQGVPEELICYLPPK